MYYMVGLRNAQRNEVRAVKAWERPYEDTSATLFYYYKKRSLVLPLVLGGTIERLDQTFLTTEYTKTSGSRFYSCATQLFEDNEDARIAYVIDTDNEWYYSVRGSKEWFKL